jgi:hypothetical protein
MPRKQPPFWDRVDKSGDCWLWTGPRRPDGYGLVSVAGRGAQLPSSSVEAY